VFDHTTAGKTLNEQVLQFPVEEISVLELIEKRVETEVEHYTQSLKKPYSGLITPKNDENELNKTSLSKRKKIDVEAQKSLAVKAFESNGFFLLVNDKQLTELDETIKITPNTSVIFIKLTPLVGG